MVSKTNVTHLVTLVLTQYKLRQIKVNTIPSQKSQKSKKFKMYVSVSRC